ncbi:MAG: FAD:protein FMN transferase [Acidimicrobiales bacterium]
MHDDVTFHVMGNRARVVVTGPDADKLTVWAQRRLEGLEARWSRFLPDSEICALNRAGGVPTIVSADTFTLIHHAVEAWSATDGWFDPTMLGELVAEGYDRSYGRLPPADATVPPLPAPEASGPGQRWSRCGDISLEAGVNLVALPPGVAFDPGGIGKGLAADMVATELMMRGAEGAMVELGGDLRVTGEHPDGGPTWAVAIDDPAQRGRDLFRFGFADGGVATSSQLQRRWSTGQGDRHHLLDPTTGAPSVSAVGTVVVATGAAWWAEVLAKSALLAGFEAGERLLRAHQAAGTLFGLDGAAHDAGLLAQAAPS